MGNVINLPKLIKAKFSYFNSKGQLYSTADGQMQDDWQKQPNSPKSRRDQIIQSNKGQMPGMTGRASAFYIYVTGSGAFLVLPEK